MSEDTKLKGALAMLVHASGQEKARGFSGLVKFPKELAHFAGPMLEKGWIVQEGEYYSPTPLGYASAPSVPDIEWGAKQ